MSPLQPRQFKQVQIQKGVQKNGNGGVPTGVSYGKTYNAAEMREAYARKKAGKENQ